MGKKELTVRIDENVIRKLDRDFGTKNRDRAVESLLKIGMYEVP